MRAGLFESLTGKYSDGTPVESVPESHRQIKSIMDHLCRLFNSRSGSIKHLVDYGLPDLSEIYRFTEEGTGKLQASIKRTVEKYEPRLKNIKVEFVSEKEKSSRMNFILSGEIVNGFHISFQTTLSATQPAEVIQYKKPE